MKRMFALLLLLPLLAVLAHGQDQKRDDWKRERDEKSGKQKDALEGKAPPALQVKDWMNTGGKPLKLEDLKGKVVVLDFWGTW